MTRTAAVLAGVVLAGLLAGCGQSTPSEGAAICAPSYRPGELAVRAKYPDLGISTTLLPAAEGSTTDSGAIKAIAAAACGLPAAPRDQICPADIGPTYELRFRSADGSAATLDAEAFGCGFVTGLDSRRTGAKTLWQAMAAAGLPTPAGR